MAVFRVQKQDKYTVMSNYHFRDQSISLKAKGLLSQMLSLPPEWNFTLAGLASINKEGIDAIRAGINELEQAGYVVRERKKGENGQFVDMEYTVYEIPRNVEEQESGSEIVQEPANRENPPLENPTVDDTNGKNPMSTAKVGKEKIQKNMHLETVSANHTDRENPILENPTMGDTDRENPPSENPTLESPMLENPTLENPMQLNKDILSKDKLNKDILKSSSVDSDSGKNDDEILKQRFDYAFAIEIFEDSKLIDMIYKELKKRDQDLLSRINGEVFMTICERVSKYADTISDKYAYVNKCIDNIILGMARAAKEKQKIKWEAKKLCQNYDLQELEETILVN